MRNLPGEVLEMFNQFADKRPWLAFSVYLLCFMLIWGSLMYWVDYADTLLK